MERRRENLVDLIQAAFATVIRREIMNADTQSYEEMEKAWDEYSIEKDQKFLDACDKFLNDAIQVKEKIEELYGFEVKSKPLSYYTGKTAPKSNNQPVKVINEKKQEPSTPILTQKLENSQISISTQENTQKNQVPTQESLQEEIEQSQSTPSINENKFSSFLTTDTEFSESNTSYNTTPQRSYQFNSVQQRLNKFIPSNEAQTQFSELPKSTHDPDTPKTAENPQNSFHFISSTDTDTQSQISAKDQVSQSIDQSEIQKMLETETENYDSGEIPINKEENQSNPNRTQEISQQERPKNQPDNIQTENPKNDTNLSSDTNKNPTPAPEQPRNLSTNLSGPSDFVKTKNVKNTPLERVDNPWWDFDSFSQYK